MRFGTAGNILVGALVAGFFFPLAAKAQTCLMLYQLADNNLEFYIRQDYQELTNSQVIRNANLKTWVYYDALNQGGQALPNTVDSSGNQVGGYTGARYLTWDSGSGKMRVDQDLGEQNSDNPTVVQNFLEMAMEDCISSGHTSMMAVFSSHAGGFAGFGGDENKRRNLLQTNANLAGAIRGALSSVSGAPDRLEVIGFDACLMQAVGVADDFKGVAEYILASEAVEPGHGWEYTSLTQANSALDLALDILNNFIDQPQGRGHQAPKTMAVVNSDGFRTFVDALEDFAGAMLGALRGGDSDLYAFVSRARATAIAFEGIVDAAGTQNPSALDIGSFLQNLDSFCNPGEEVGNTLDATIAAYNSMFSLVRNGPGTAQGTGMHITWPNQGEYSRNANLWDTVLFNNANYVTAITPKFREFLQYFLPAGSSGGGGGSTVCGLGAQVDQDPNPEEFIKSASGEVDASGNYVVDTQISGDVSQMLVEYGIDLTTPLGPFLETDVGYPPGPNNYLYLMGGDVVGTYQGDEFTASWDTNFYFLNITGAKQFEALYVFDQGNGMKKIPAMYFPKELEENLGTLQKTEYLFFDFDAWQAKGARFAFWQFSVDEAEGRVNDNLALYVAQEDDGTFAEKPRSAGGFIAPLVYVDAFVEVNVDGELKGGKIDTLPGGFNQTVVVWNETLNYNVLTTPYKNVFNVIPSADAIVVNVYAYNYNAGDDVENPQSVYFDVDRRNDRKPDLSATRDTFVPLESDSPGTDLPTAGSVSVHFSVGLGLVACAVAFLSFV